jgi:hypothetical protein
MGDRDLTLEEGRAQRPAMVNGRCAPAEAICRREQAIERQESEDADRERTRARARCSRRYSARGKDEGILINSEKISFHEPKRMRMGTTNRPSTALIVVTERMLDAEDAGDFVAAAYWAAVRARVIIRIGNEVGQRRDPA